MISAFMAAGVRLQVSGFRKSGGEQPVFLDYSVRAQAGLLVVCQPVRFLIHFVIAIEMRFVLSQLRGKERREDVALAG
jgi:hypothetical protein